jgi:hypothetical protein
MMLLDLFPELHERIVDSLDSDPSACASLALSCRGLRHHAQRALLHAVELNASTHVQFRVCMADHPRLSSLVRFLSLDGNSPIYADRHTVRPEALSTLLSLLPSLCSLSLYNLDWTLAKPSATALFGAHPRSSVVHLALTRCQIDFGTSFRVFLTSFPNVRTLALNQTRSVCAGYSVGEQDRYMDRLERLVVRGICEGLKVGFRVLPARRLRSIEMEIRSKESLNILARVCMESAEALEELEVSLGRGIDGSCGKFFPRSQWQILTGEHTVLDSSVLDLSTNRNLRRLCIRGVDLGPQSLRQQQTSWLLDILTPIRSEELATVCYGVTVYRPEDLCAISWDDVGQVIREKGGTRAVDAEVLVDDQSCKGMNQTAVASTAAVIFQDNPVLRGSVVSGSCMRIC